MDELHDEQMQRIDEIGARGLVNPWKGRLRPLKRRGRLSLADPS